VDLFDFFLLSVGILSTLTVGATSGEGTAYPSGASEYASLFSKVRVA
jgi:hypothetical protein